MVASIFSVATNLSVPDPCDTEEGMCHFVPTNGTFGIAKVQKNIFINVKRWEICTIGKKNTKKGNYLGGSRKGSRRGWYSTNSLTFVLQEVLNSQFESHFNSPNFQFNKFSLKIWRFQKLSLHLQHIFGTNERHFNDSIVSKPISNIILNYLYSLAVKNCNPDKSIIYVQFRRT